MEIAPPSRVVVPLLAALSLAACTAAQRPGQLLGMGGVEQAALDDCRAPVQAKLCGASDAGDACWAGIVKRYESLPHVVARKQFLIDSGCPSPRVEAWLPDPR